MGWLDGDPHDHKGCLTAFLIGAIFWVSAAVIVVVVFGEYHR